MVVAAFFVYHNLNQTLKNTVLQKFSEKFPHLGVEFDSVYLQESKGVMLRGVRFYGKAPDGSRRVVLEADEFFIEVPINIQAFLKGNTVPERLTVKKSKIHLLIAEEGTLWGLELFQTDLKEDVCRCPIEFSDVSIICRDLRKSDFSPIVFSGGTLLALPPNHSGQQGPASKQETTSSPFWTISGSMSNSLLKHLEIEGVFDEKTRDFLFQGKLDEFRWSKDFTQFSKIPDAFAESVKSFRGKIGGRFTLGRDSARLTSTPLGLFFQADGRMYDGRVEFPVLTKKPITEMSLNFQITQDSVQATNIFATSGLTCLTATWKQTGLFTPRQAVFSSQIKELPFSNEFIESLAAWLPEKLSHFLEDYRYDGTADLDTVLLFDGTHWTSHQVDCRFHDLNISYEKFPYRVDSLKGSITISPENELALNLKTEHEKKVIMIAGNIAHVNTVPQGVLTIVGTFVPIDDKLIKSISHKVTRTTIYSLQPTGEITTYFQLTIPGNGRPVEPFLQIALCDCGIRYEKFPMPLHKIKGIIEMQGDNWRFRDMHGWNGTAHVSGNGHLIPVGNGYEFRLSLDAKGLEIGPGLTNAILNKNQQELITNLNIRGIADLPMIEIAYYTAQEHLSVSFDALFSYPETTSVKPVYFPYQLENVSALVRYRDGEVLIENFSGQNDETKISGGIHCQFKPDGSWSLYLKKLLAVQLYHNRSFITAIPPEVRDLINNLKITGAVTLQGEMLFTKGMRVDDPMISTWNLGVIFLQNGANIGVDISNICGKVHLLGRSDGASNLVFGEFEFDGCNYNDMQITEIHGPFYFHDQQLSLGRHAYIPRICTRGVIPLEQFAKLQFPKRQAEPPLRQVSFQQSQQVFASAESSGYATGTTRTVEPAAQSRSLTGKLFGGTILVDGNVFIDPIIKYLLETQVLELDLSTASMELMTQNKGTGKLSAQAMISGEGRSRDTIKGNGELELHEANLYQFPIMMELTKLLRVNVDKEQNGITSCNLSFQIQGNKAVLDPISLDGTAISLTGQGDMNLDTTDISLLLGVRLGNSKTQIPVVSDIVGGAGDNIIRIRAEGPLTGKLSVKRVPLLGVRSSLQEQSDAKPSFLKRIFRNPF